MGYKLVLVNEEDFHDGRMEGFDYIVVAHGLETVRYILTSVFLDRILADAGKTWDNYEKLVKTEVGGTDDTALPSKAPFTALGSDSERVLDEPDSLGGKVFILQPQQ